MKFKLFIALILISGSVLGQEDLWDKWNEETIKKANTAAGYQYYSEDEKKVVLFMNLARLDGKLFAETILTEYVRSNGIADNAYLKSLYRDLRKLGSLDPLIPQDDLTSIAQGHATASGKSGHVGHKDFKSRFEPYMGNPYNNVGENCSYGYAKAIDIVVTLLIDDGVKGVGHRVNTLKPEFNSVGVAIREHKTYRYNCVIDFGKKSGSSLNDLPF